MRTCFYTTYSFWILAGYLSGSVLYAYYLPLCLRRIDVTKLSDDGNPGAANAFQYAGVPIGCMVIVCELLKAFLPVFFASRFLNPSRLPFALVMAAPVAGHAFSIFFKGKGGKATAASFGVMLALFPELYPFAALAFFYLFFSTIVVIRPHLYRSIVTFLCFTAAVCIKVPVRALRLGCGLISGITVWKHVASHTSEVCSVRLFGLGRRR